MLELQDINFKEIRAFFPSGVVNLQIMLLSQLFETDDTDQLKQ